MSEATATAETDATGGLGDLQSVVLAGVLSGVIFGVLIQFVMGRMTAIGAMYTLGDPSLSVGWLAHLLHSGVFALVFGVLTWWRLLDDRMGTPVGSVGIGTGYGFLLWLVNIGFVWPLWLNTVGLTNLPVPYLASLRPLVGHLLWGGLLGGLYWLLRSR